MRENGERRYRIWRCKKMKVLSFSHSLKSSFSYIKREVCNFNFVEIVCLDLSKIPKFSLSWLELNKLTFTQLRIHSSQDCNVIDAKCAWFSTSVVA
ncbi:hypothetical protein NC651_015252 [Populus alba x Populus x berolinensis]|nr:hypothetical protein NC651_015252 [Populus alba x Populus x berolinensis]